ncbi:MAG: SDR family oxidoreductase [Gammaproteobacteria bacterium]|nr:SDR family oxidoreductase [Gammaproteobacteria bacterium]
MQKIILITGGSRGIGAATVRLAAGAGYAVVFSYLKAREVAEALCAEIRDAGGAACAIQADVALEADVVRLFETADREVGKLTALVNNAGVAERQRRCEEMSAARLSRVFATNVIGSFLCAREAVKRMSTRHGGQGGGIVNVSSAASRLGSPGEFVDYAASKGAIDTFTIGLAKEVAGEGIRVNAVRPGVIYTDIHASYGEPGRVDRVKDSVPMRRGGDAEEVAKAILWLLSDDASYSTGAFIDVSGGR